MTDQAPQPGWYSDPSSGVQRYWDGERWTATAPPPQQQPSIVVNNTVGSLTPVVVTGGCNHVLHLLLTVFTCGMWAPIWVIAAIVQRPRVAGQPEGSDGSGGIGLVLAVGFGVLLVLGVLGAHPWLLAVFVPLAVAGVVGWRLWQRREEQAAIAARADAQHRARLWDDLYSKYGEYPPVILPEGETK